jgi:hypothetical protein
MNDKQSSSYRWLLLGSVLILCANGRWIFLPATWLFAIFML